MAGKGDTHRPMSVPYSEWEKNWDLIFGKKPTKGKTHGKEPVVKDAASTDKLDTAPKNA